MRDDELLPLIVIGRLILDKALADFERANSACAESRERLAAIDVNCSLSDLPLAAIAQAEMRYALWADARRTEINLCLSRQTAIRLVAQAAAVRAFGHTEVLRRLRERF
jgi:hypothetical protein